MATKVQMTKGGKKLRTISLSIFFKLQGGYFFKGVYFFSNINIEKSHPNNTCLNGFYNIFRSYVSFS
jgi:hypothetical protein